MPSSEGCRGRAAKLFEAQNDPLKVEIVAGIPEGSLSCYEQKDFIDLCRGPHVPSTGKLGVFKLTHSAGAYWKGDERNPMLQRIYGAVFLTQKDLDEHLARLEAARARDHRKLGKELSLFVFHPWAPASPFFLPKGATVYNLLVAFMRDLYVKYGYQEVVTPRSSTSSSSRRRATTRTPRQHVLHPDRRARVRREVWCRGTSCSTARRRIPIGPAVRFADFGRLHRYEKSGVTQGLTRVRTFAQDDSHIFCAIDQMAEEMNRFLDFIREVYETFAFREVKVGLGTRPEKFMGAIENWDKAENALKDAFERRAASLPGWSYFLNAGDGAFYGPKIDFQVTDAIGRAWRLGTLRSTSRARSSSTSTTRPRTGRRSGRSFLHRAILGSLERFFGILIEHTGGDFPFWLAPEQVRVVPVSEKFNEYGEEILRRVREAGLRASCDQRNEKLGAKIRNGELEKVPALLIVGEKEVAAETVSLRVRHGGEFKDQKIEELLRMMRGAVATRSLLARPSTSATIRRNSPSHSSEVVPGSRPPRTPRSTSTSCVSRVSG